MLAGPKLVYTLRCLQTLRSAVLPDDVKTVIHKLGLRRQRGCRYGWAARAHRARPVPVLQPVGNGAFTVVTDQSDHRLPSQRHRVPVCDLRHLTRITVHRHMTSAGRAVLLTCLQSVQCHGKASLLGEQICSHDSTASAATLAKSPERIQFRLCVLTYRCLNGTAPQYLS